MNSQKASDRIQYYRNADGPVIGTVSRPVIEQDGLFFKDIDGSGTVSPVNDWRLPAKERAEAYAAALNTKEKIGQLFISDWRMAKYPPSGPMAPENYQVVPDESGLLDEGALRGKTIFGEQNLPGTTELLRDWFSRHLILRANAKPDEIADWINQLHAVAETCGHFVPVQVVSNSRN